MLSMQMDDISLLRLPPHKVDDEIRKVTDHLPPEMAEPLFTALAERYEDYEEVAAECGAIKYLDYADRDKLTTLLRHGHVDEALKLILNKGIRGERKVPVSVLSHAVATIGEDKLLYFVDELVRLHMLYVDSDGYATIYRIIMKGYVKLYEAILNASSQPNILKQQVEQGWSNFASKPEYKIAALELGLPNLVGQLPYMMVGSAYANSTDYILNNLKVSRYDLQSLAVHFSMWHNMYALGKLLDMYPENEGLILEGFNVPLALVARLLRIEV